MLRERTMFTGDFSIEKYAVLVLMEQLRHQNTLEYGRAVPLAPRRKSLSVRGLKTAYRVFRRGFRYMVTLPSSAPGGVALSKFIIGL